MHVLRLRVAQYQIEKISVKDTSGFQSAGAHPPVLSTTSIVSNPNVRHHRILFLFNLEFIKIDHYHCQMTGS